MPVLQLNEQQFPLAASTTRIGAGEGVDIALPTQASLGVQALVESAGGERLAIRRASPGAMVRVNGVLLGAEPTPLMHGDKVEIGGLELRYAEDKKGGATQFVSASDIASMAGPRRAGAARPTAASGGRLVSLVDGKEYLVTGAALLIGRDASADVVVGQHEVSRRHAEIVPSEQGYLVRDLSANGVFVNGERVQGSRQLMRADVLRIGGEEFRFYADVLAAGAEAKSAPVTSAAASAVASSIVAPASAGPVMPVPATPMLASQDEPTAPLPKQPRPESATSGLGSAPSPLAVRAAPDTRPELAWLEILNEGPMKGRRYSLTTPLAHVGRGEHNDVQLVDESVSETHAKLQRREEGWYLVDMESTNGTYVGGSRVHGERRLEGSPDLRFGGVKARFTAAVAESAAKGTRAIAAVTTARVTTSPRGTGASAQGAEQSPVPRSGLPGWLWFVAALVLAAAAFFVLKGRV